MILLQYEPDSPIPAYLQVRDRIVALVDDGTLRPGDRLPPTRTLAHTTGVHRSTVVRAFDELRALGYVESRPGSYTTVRSRARLPATSPAANTPRRDEIDWEARATRQVRAAHRQSLVWRSSDEGVVDFERLAADPSLAPDDELRHCLRESILRGRGAVLDYTDPAGWPPLREVLAARLRAHGVAVAPDEILITSGAQHALDLILRMLASTGDRVVVEAPSYAMAHALLRVHGIGAIEVPVRDDGMDLDSLERRLRRGKPKMVYTMPSFQNPTGVTTDQAHRERLLEMCEQHRVPLVEDGFEEEMKYFGHAVLPIKSMDTHGVVLYVGTFSKVVFSGLRVGWIAAPRAAIRMLTSIHHACCLSTNTLAQAAIARFCSGGAYELHLRRVHRVYRRRMEAMLCGLAEHMPPEVRWTRPAGGYALWLTLPCEARGEEHWERSLMRAGVKVSVGSRFFRKAPSALHLRLSIACVEEDAIRDGCGRLGKAIRALLSQGFGTTGHGRIR